MSSIDEIYKEPKLEVEPAQHLRETDRYPLQAHVVAEPLFLYEAQARAVAAPGQKEELPGAACFVIPGQRALYEKMGEPAKSKEAQAQAIKYGYPGSSPQMTLTARFYLIQFGGQMFN